MSKIYYFNFGVGVFCFIATILNIIAFNITLIAVTGILTIANFGWAYRCLVKDKQEQMTKSENSSS